MVRRICEIMVTVDFLFRLVHCSSEDVPFNFCFLFVFVALRPMSTAMVIAGRSVHLTTLFPGQA